VTYDVGVRGPRRFLLSVAAGVVVAVLGLPGLAQAAGGPLAYLTGLACPSSTQCTAVGRGLVFTFDPAAPGEPTATIIAGDVEESGLACPTSSRCTAVDSSGHETTFDPLAPGAPTPVEVDRGGALTAVACPTSSQCTAVDAAGQETTFDPTAPGAAGASVPVLIDPATAGAPVGSLTGLACPTAGQCTAVDSAGREATFDPAAPGAPSPAIIYPSGLASANPFAASSNTLDAVACPSAGQCTAVGYERELTFDPAAPGSPKPVTIAAESSSAVACPESSRCTAIDPIGQEITFDPAAPLLPSPIRIDGVAVTPSASVSAGRARVSLTCGFRATGPCKVILGLLAHKRGGRSATLASRTVTVPVGRSETVELALGAAGRRLASARGKLTVTLSIAQRESDELRWTVEQALTFNAPARHQSARHRSRRRA
jgi:hypothetical protein